MSSLEIFRRVAVVVVLAAVALAGQAQAQESESAPLAAELAELLSASGMGAIAARDTADEDRFVAALAFPGTLLVVSARLEVALYVEQKIADGQYREAYIDLNAASIPETKVLITDTGGGRPLRRRRFGRHGRYRFGRGPVRWRCGRRRAVRAHAAGIDRRGALIPLRLAADGASLPVHCTFDPDRALGSVVEHRLHTAGVSGSNPLAPTTARLYLRGSGFRRIPSRSRHSGESGRRRSPGPS